MQARIRLPYLNRTTMPTGRCKLGLSKPRSKSKSWSIAAFQAGMPNSLSVALLVLAGLFPVLVWRSLLHSRAAWAFLVSICWVLAVVLLFGAPKVRSKMEIGLWTAMIIPGLLFVAGVALVAVRREYRDFRDLR